MFAKYNKMMKTRKMRWAGNIVRMGEKRDSTGGRITRRKETTIKIKI
jgi:hypothetical protein